MPLTKRKADRTDIPFLLRLRRSTMNRHIEASGASTADEEHMKRIELEFESAQILELDGRQVGLLKVVRRGSDWELLQIQLVTELQGTGLGAALVQELLTEARSAGAAVHLSVLKANPARRLYERLGFVLAGETEHSFRMVRRAGDA
jgi:GNAT superfamily N-acetyltransferase